MSRHPHRDPNGWIAVALVVISASLVGMALTWLLDREVPPGLVVLALVALGAGIIAVVLDEDR